jgi:ABC-type lipoprotein export system ATPase subunit
MLSLIDVNKDYPSPGSNEPIHILKDVNLQVKEGKSISIVGPSGSGKSTLLNIISGLEKPTSGKVLIDGEDIQNFTAERLAEMRNQQIGFVFQLHHLFPQFSVLENVLVPTLAGFGPDISSEDYKKRASGLIESVGLSRFSHYRPGELSVGQRQRVAVARALINKPKLLLADEPTGSLDTEIAKQITELLLELNSNTGVTLVVVTHSIVLAEKMDNMWLLSDGKLTEKAN